MEQQHLLVMIKSTDSDEPYGMSECVSEYFIIVLFIILAECCIALGSVIDPKPQKVTRELIHQGLSAGEFEYDINNNNNNNNYLLGVISMLLWISIRRQSMIPRKTFMVCIL